MSGAATSQGAAATEQRGGYKWTASTDGALGIAKHEGCLDVVGQRPEPLLTEHSLDEGEDALRGAGRRCELEDDPGRLRPRRDLEAGLAPEVEDGGGERVDVSVVDGGDLDGLNEVDGQLALEAVDARGDSWRNGGVTGF